MSSTQNRTAIPFTGLLVLLGAIALIEWFFFQGVLLDFDKLIGDAGDARFNNLVLEHWFKVFQGREAFFDLPIFYPVKGTLGYSDTLLLLSLPYALFRFFGCDLLVANKLTLILVHLVGSLGMVWLQVRFLRIEWPFAVIGLVLFSMGNAYFATGAHTQLYLVSLLPLLTALVLLFWENRHQNFGHMAPAFLGAIGLFFLTLISSYYVGYFSALFGFVVLVVQAWHHRRELKIAWSRTRDYLFTNRLMVVLGALVALGLGSLFLAIYLPTLMEFGRRGLDEVRWMLPRWFDFFALPDKNLLWGDLQSKLVPFIRTRPYSGELYFGFPPITAVTLLMTVIVLWRKRPRAGTLKGTAEDRGHRLSFALFLAVVCSMLLFVKVDGTSLWYAVSYLVPGAGGIRAVSRFSLILLFPVAIVVAFEAQKLIPRQWKTRSKVAVALTLSLLLAVDNYSRDGVSSRWSRSAELAKIQQVPLPPKEAKAFYLRPTGTLLWVYPQLDGWMLAESFGLPTANGYSGQFPGAWIEYGVNDGVRPTAIRRWADRWNQDKLFLYDPEVKGWSRVDPLHFSVMDHRLDTSKLGYAITPLGQDQQGLHFHLVNTGTERWPAVGLPSGANTIRLSWRFVDQERRSLENFERRQDLGADLEPGAGSDCVIPLDLKAFPTASFVEIALVQEAQFWFQDVGVRTALVPLGGQTNRAKGM